MNARRFVLTIALLCLAAITALLPARSVEWPQPAQPDANALPAFGIAVCFCLAMVLLWTLLWIGVLKLVEKEPAYGET